MPNLKFDNVARSAGSAPPESVALFRQLAGIPEDAMLVVLASVREEEEDLLLPVLRALTELSSARAPVALAVAPRHMHRVQAWKKKLATARLSFVQRSRHNETVPRHSTFAHPLPLCLWDTFGELQTLYAASDLAFVGGSLVRLGGQNFLEALAQGIPTLVGPHTDNFSWVGQDLFTSGLVRRVADTHALTATLQETLAQRRQALSERAAAALPPSVALGQARASLHQESRELFLSWLAPRTGGNTMAAQTLLTMISG